jgi:hypothetical protein
VGGGVESQHERGGGSDRSLNGGGRGGREGREGRGGSSDTTTMLAGGMAMSHEGGYDANGGNGNVYGNATSVLGGYNPPRLGIAGGRDAASSR